jgi:hypothetical protein
MENVLDKRCKEQPNTHFLFSKIFPKIIQFFKNNEHKCDRARQATDGNSK